MLSVHNNRKRQKKNVQLQLTPVDIYINRYKCTHYTGRHCASKRRTFLQVVSLSNTHTQNGYLLFQLSAIRKKTASLSADGRWFSERRRRNNTDESERNTAAATDAGSISKTRQPAPTFPLFSLCFFPSLDDPQPY